MVLNQQRNGGVIFEDYVFKNRDFVKFQRTRRGGKLKKGEGGKRCQTVVKVLFFRNELERFKTGLI